MNLNALKAAIKPLDCSVPPAISDAERDYFRFYGLNFEETLASDIAHYFGHFPCDRFDIVAHYFAHPEARQTCFIVHGYYDHAGLFGHLIRYCLERQHSVVIFDLPGHGLSTGERASIDSFDRYQRVLRGVLDLFQGIVPEPRWALGQSTGGAILMDHMLSGGTDTFTKVVLLAPLYRPGGWRLARLLHSLLAPFVDRIKRRFAPNSHDAAFLNFLRQGDPLQYQYLPLAWLSALKQWIRHFDQLPESSCAPLVIQGQEDLTVDWKRNIPAIQAKFPCATVFYLKQGRHHLANESEEIREKMFSAISLYLERAA